jgi:enolase
MKIKHILGREIFDSRGWPTVQCEIILENDQSVLASVPAGISTGDYEAVELRDGGKRLFGQGVLKAISNIDQIIAPVLVNHEPNAIEMDLKIIELDGTADKSRLGANAMLAVSTALYKAEALVEGLEPYELIAALMDEDTVSIPYPLINIINGGLHANNNLQIQEFLIVPIGAPTFRSAFEMGVLVYHELKELLKSNGKSVAVGEEGGFACDFKSDYEALDFLLAAIERVSEQHPLSCVIALDMAASYFYDTETHLYKWRDKHLTSDEMIAFYQELIGKYPIYSIEDGLSQDDWQGWAAMTKALENKVQVVGDDLFATNIYRIALGVEEHAATSVIIKPNQIGTITETLQAIHFSKSYGLNTIVSHRSAETEDSFIADLAVGSSAGQIKAGSCARGERLAKYNRLLGIEDTLTLGLLDS